MSYFDRLPLDILRQLSASESPMVCPESELATVIDELKKFDFEVTEFERCRLYNFEDRIAVLLVLPVLAEDGTVTEPGQMHLVFWKKGLSNFVNVPIKVTVPVKMSDCSVETHVVKLPCTEAGFQADKAIFFEDFEAVKGIIFADTPQECKALGNKIPKFDKNRWNKWSIDSMQSLVDRKMATNPEVQELIGVLGGIAKTHRIEFPNDLKVYEASPLDDIWGTGRDVPTEVKGLIESLSGSTAPSSGKNQLGKCWESAIKMYMGGSDDDVENKITPVKKARFEEPSPEPRLDEVISCTPGEDETVPDATKEAKEDN